MDGRVVNMVLVENKSGAVEAIIDRNMYLYILGEVSNLT